MDASLNNYLKSIIPNWSDNKNPLDTVTGSDTGETSLNFLTARILSDMSQITFEHTRDKRLNQGTFMYQVFKLNTLIQAYGFIENAARSSGISEGLINHNRVREFTEYKNSLRRLGVENGLNEIEQFEDVTNEFQRLSISNVPKENTYEKQIRKMVLLVKNYLDNNTNINSIDENGQTQFCFACRFGDLDRAKLLLSLGCDPNIPDSDGATPFYIACNLGFTEIVNILIKDERVDPNITYKECPPLFTACEHGFDEIVSIIANSKKANLSATFGDQPLLSVTIHNGHIKCARILIEAGADINERDGKGNTLFHMYVENKNLEKAEMLLLLGCDPNIPDSDGFTPFYTACNKGFTEMVNILIKDERVDPNIKSNGCPPLVTACDNGFDEIVSIIANSNKANLDATFGNQTSLKVAVNRGHEKCARILIEAGADIDKRYEDGYTLFHTCVKSKNLKKVEMLLSLGCDPNIPDSNGITPFYTACNKGLIDIVNILIKDERTDPNIKSRGCPPINAAMEHGFDEIVSIIAKSKRANLNATFKGKTTLSFAISKRNEKCAKILLDEGADFTSFDSLLKNVEEEERENNHSNTKHIIPKKRTTKRQALDTFCSFIASSLKNGLFQEFKNFLFAGIYLNDSTIQYIIDFLILEIGGLKKLISIVNIIERYEQILSVEIERPGALKKLEKLKLAYFIEIELPKIGYVAHQVYSQHEREYTRTIITEKGGNYAYILSKKQFSIIRGKGGFKDVKSALLVPLKDRSLKVERVVYARIIKKTKAGAIEALEEYDLIKEFSGHTGFGKAYKFFCFDNINYVSRQELRVAGRECNLRTSIVLEEMDDDLDKIIKNLTLNEQESVAKQLVTAINTMMMKGKVSWDLKPCNVLVSKNYQLKKIKVSITDLGFARDISQGKAKEVSVYGSPWFGAPELLYATAVVDDAYTHLQCEMWALGLVLYKMCFKKTFPLIDLKYFDDYQKYRHLPVKEQVAHYQLPYDEYMLEHDDLIEKPLRELLLKPKKNRSNDHTLKILTYRMLQLDRNMRITPTEAEEFVRDYKYQDDEEKSPSRSKTRECVIS